MTSVPFLSRADGSRNRTPEDDDGVEHEAPFDSWSSAWDGATPSDAEAIARWQLDRAWAVAERLAASNPFYAERLRLPAERTAEALRELPESTKSEIVADCQAHPPYGSRTTAAAREIRHVVETSGTSGKGREIYGLDAADEQAIFKAEAVGFWWAGVRPGTPVLLTLPVGVSAAGLWYYGALRLIGANVLAVGSYDKERKVELLRRYGAEVIVGTPSYVERLLSACAEGGYDPASLGIRAVVVAGEAYTAEWARSIQERWGGAELYEQYGSTERIMAWACPGGVLKDGALGTLHVPAELAHWEVLDPETNAPVADGEWGHLVHTPLDAAASPLFRFATRDRVQYVAPGSCACGRPLGGIRAGGVQRYDDMLKIRGVNVWPRALDDAVFAVAGVRDYRGTVSHDSGGRERVRLRVELETGASADEVLARIAAQLRRSVGLVVEADAVEPGAIAGETPEGYVKVARWRDERRLTG
jgi:phenylacetate-CoA ligase